MDHPMRKTQVVCKHDSQFHCTTVSNMQQNDYFYAFACSQQCGFFMNYDPSKAGLFRKNDWKNFGVAFTQDPTVRSDGKEWKTSLPFASEFTKIRPNR